MPNKTDLIDRIETFLKQERELYGSFDASTFDDLPEPQPEQAPPTEPAITPPEMEKPDASPPSSESADAAQPSTTTDLNSVSTLDELHSVCLISNELRTDLEGTNLVFGVGNPDADLMLIGEAPGENEDKQGEPFVGRAGQLLNKILEAIHFKREEIYISNILKHRPPKNRDPLPEERQRSLPYLYRQIEIINPKLILCLGRISAQTLLDTNKPMKAFRGSFHPFMQDRELMVTFHPAALLRNPAWKRDTWEDVQKLRARYDEVTS